MKFFGFDYLYNRDNLVGFECGGAYIMLGRKTGVVERLSKLRSVALYKP